MTALQSALDSILLDDDTDRIPRFSRYTLNPRIQHNVDALVLEQAAKGPQTHLRLLDASRARCRESQDCRPAVGAGGH